MKPDKRLLDLGSGDEQIGTNKVIESATRKLLHPDTNETIQGAKTLNVPAHSPIEPSLATDFVPKGGLLNMVRCTGEPCLDMLTITAEDIVNGYATLHQAVAAGQTASFRVVEFEGASALSPGLDFTIAADESGDLTRFKWTGFSLARPGRMIVGQEITVQYNYCVPVVPLEDLGPLSELWMLDDYSAHDPIDPNGGNGYAYDRSGMPLRSAYNVVPIPTTASESELVFRNFLTGDTRTLTLPTLQTAPDGNSGYFLTVFRGMPILYTLPTTGAGMVSTTQVTSPFMAGKVEVYASDWSVWGKVLELDPPDYLTADNASRITGGNEMPQVGVAIFGDEYLGIVYTHLSITKENYTSAFIEKPDTIIVDLYDRSFAFVSRKTVTGGVI
jgi:hypothetical protein